MKDGCKGEAGAPPEDEERRWTGLAADVVACSVDGIVAIDLEERILLWNRAMESLTGVSASACVGRRVHELTSLPQVEQVQGAFRRALQGESILAAERLRLGEKVLEAHYAPLRRPVDGVAGGLAIFRDVSAELRLEEQLAQAQKMEAVGQLAGGVAHDFNNLLMAILGYCDLALLAPPGGDVRGDLEEIRRAAQRAAELTGRLLAFSRKQVLQPRVIELDREVRELEPMMRRLLGENVELVYRTEGRARIHADPGQLQQVLVNLMVNARDAMPGGGRIVVETSDAELDEHFARTHVGARAGHYALLAVSDTGIGMDAATKARIFEPFFTTKERGKGTGLGLSQVYGVVKQSGGSIWVYSEPGRGTTFKIYLPAVDAPAEARRSAGEHRATVPGGSETILVAEDDEGVRTLVVRLLANRGYRVLAAVSGAEAIELAARSPAVDLLVTDVVMTDMSGQRLADELRRRWPTLPVLFMSGYTNESIAHYGVLAEGARLLPKPFTAESLALQVREALAGD